MYTTASIHFLADLHRDTVLNNITFWQDAAECVDSSTFGKTTKANWDVNLQLAKILTEALPLIMHGSDESMVEFYDTVLIGSLVDFHNCTFFGTDQLDFNAAEDEIRATVRFTEPEIIEETKQFLREWWEEEKSLHNDKIMAGI